MTSPASSVMPCDSAWMMRGILNHVRGVRVLAQFTIDLHGHTESMRIRDCTLVNDPGAHRTKRVQSLPLEPLVVTPLHITGCDVIDDRVSEDMVVRTRLRNITRTQTQHHT